MSEIVILNNERASGKTASLVELALREAQVDKKIVLLVMNTKELSRIHSSIREQYYTSNYEVYSKFISNVRIADYSQKRLISEYFKGFHVDAILVDECFHMPLELQSDLIKYALANKITLIGNGTKMQDTLTFESFLPSYAGDGMPTCRHGVPYDSECVVCESK